MNDKHIDELIDRALRQEQELPEGLSERLEGYIDQLAAVETHQKQTRHAKRRTLYWLTAVAASLFLGIALFFPTEEIHTRPTTADTFTDPEEAALVAQEALAFLSSQFNKGLNQVSEAQEEVQKVNAIVNTQIKEIYTP